MAKLSTSQQKSEQKQKQYSELVSVDFPDASIYLWSMTKLKKTSTRMTQRQFAELAGVALSTASAWKKAGELNAILDDQGLILAGKARAWVMRKVKHEKKEVTP